MSRLGRISARLFAPGALYHLLASTAFVVVFAIVPFSLYLHSGEEWALTPVLLLKLAGLGLLALLATVLGLRLLAALSRSAAVTIALGLFCLGLFVLLAHVYAPVAIGPLDGEEIRSDEPLSYTLIEGTLLLGAVALFVLLRRGRGLVTASVFAGILWLVGLGYAIAATWPSRSTAVVASPSDKSTPASCKAEGNVYQIVLDTLETDAFLKVIHDNDWADEFDGFDLLINNIANYMITMNSKASYLTGRFYHFGDLDEWREKYTEGMLAHLSAAGFESWTYTWANNWKYEYADVFQSNFSVFRERVGEPQAEFYTFLRVWLVSVAPNTITHEAIRFSVGVAERLLAWLTTGRDDLKIDFHRYASVLLLEQLALDEAVRKPSCSYIYVHPVIPHGPHVLDGRCRPVGDWQHRPQKIGIRAAYLEQTECGVRKVIDFLRELKRLRRYGSASIILHADTGDHWNVRSKQPDAQDKILGWRKARLLGRAQALLMIKRPHARHPLEIIEKPTQLVDVYPTILDLLGMEQPPGLHGRSVYARAVPPREARFALDPEDPKGPNLIEVRIDDPTDLGGSTLTAVGPATDPALWRDEIKRAHARSPYADKAAGATAASRP